MTEKYILFDFDGTVADSSEGVFAGVLYAFEKMGMEKPDSNELRRFIGPPLKESFMTRHGLNGEESDRAVAYYRELYSESGVLMCRAYEGIDRLFENLNKKGFTLAIATSKPEKYAVQILDYLGLSHHFAYIAGAQFHGARTDKPSVIEYALESLNISPSQALMVGDRFHDIEGAKSFGMRCACVTWGFGDRAEFEHYGADFICENMKELEELILNLPDKE